MSIEVTATTASLHQAMDNLGEVNTYIYEYLMHVASWGVDTEAVARHSRILRAQSRVLSHLCAAVNELDQRIERIENHD